MQTNDAKGRPPGGERFSEYFEAERGDRYVRRHELAAILQRYDQARRQNTWYSKLWRWLRSERGKPVYAVEPPKAQVEREAREREIANNSEFKRR